MSLISASPRPGAGTVKSGHELVDLVTVKRPTPRSVDASPGSALTRRRSHQTVDLLLGLILLIGAASWIASASPALALAFAAATVGGYLVNLRRQEVNGRELATPSRRRGTKGGDALDALDAALAAAPAIPLTGWVRVDPGELSPLVDDVRVAAKASGCSDQAEELAQVVLGGRPVPFTNELRSDRRRARRLLSRLRSSLG